jgi:hypothetical protein
LESEAFDVSITPAVGDAELRAQAAALRDRLER